MSNPVASDRHVSTPLTVMSIAYMQDTSEFVARRMFPTIPTSKKYDKFYVFEKADMLRAQMKQRAPSTESQEGRYRLSTSNYQCDVFALHKKIDDEERANSDDVFSLDAEATDFLTYQALLKEEVDFAAKYVTSGVWGTTVTGVAAAPSGVQFLQWNDGNSTPIEDIEAASMLIKQNTGRRANKLLLTDPVWRQLKNHPDIVDRIKGGATQAAPAYVQRALIAQLLELDEVMVMGGIQNTAVEGAAASNSFIGGKSALLVHTPSAPGRMTPAAGYTFGWRGYIGGTSPVAISRFREDLRKCDRIEIEAAYVQQITGSDLGYFFASAVA